jgi:hypothetical protein
MRLAAEAVQEGSALCPFRHAASHSLIGTAQADTRNNAAAPTSDRPIDLSTSHQRPSGHCGAGLTTRRLVPAAPTMRAPKEAIHLAQPCPGPLPTPVLTDLNSRSRDRLLNQAVATQDETGGHVASATPGGAPEGSLGMGVPTATASSRDLLHGTTIIACGRSRPPSLRTRSARPACVNDVAHNRTFVTAEANPTMAECCGHWSHGDGGSPPLRQAGQARATAAASQTGLVAVRRSECMRSLSSIQERERCCCVEPRRAFTLQNVD